LSKVPLISIVDDDDSVRNATKGLLRSLGYDVAAFASAEEFLQSGRLDDTSCLIADVRMPGLNGFDLQRHLLDSGHRTPVIFITAFPGEGMRVRALRQGACGFLRKPFAEACLIKCLDRVFQNNDVRGIGQ